MSTSATAVDAPTEFTGVLRYGAVGYLAMRFGAPAKNLLAEHYPTVFLILIFAVGLGLLVGWRWRGSAR